MTESTRRDKPEKRKPNKHGFVNYGGGSKEPKTDIGKKLMDAFEKGKGKP